MNPLISQGLLITVIGMSLVFTALALLWGLMALLLRLERQPAPSAPASEPAIDATVEQPTADELAAIAAALAVVRAEREANAAIPWRLPPVLTRWAAVGYARQLRSWQPRQSK